MKMKNRFLLIGAILTALSGSCSNTDNTDIAVVPETRLFVDGQIVTSEFSKDDVVIESMIDTVVNLGSIEDPALFYLNGSHLLNSLPIENGNAASNVFRSLSRQDLHSFIHLWAKVVGTIIDPNDNSPAALLSRQSAYRSLQDFLIVNGVDLPLMISLSKDAQNLQSVKNLIDATRIASSSVKRDNPNTPDNILNAIEISGIQPVELTSAVANKGLSMIDFVNMVNRKGINFPETLKAGLTEKGEVMDVIDGIVEGLVKVSKILVWFIEHGAPSIDIEDTYVSYLHKDDIDPMHYIHSTSITSPVYSVAYCTLAKASFYMETNYDAENQTHPGQYINRVGMIVKSVRCSGAMHVKGKTEFEIPHTEGTAENPIACTSGTITVEYGDCCASARKAKLTFKLRGDTGYDETSWDSKVK